MKTFFNFKFVSFLTILTIFLFVSNARSSCVPQVTNGYWHSGYNAFVCLGTGDVTCVISCPVKKE